MNLGKASEISFYLSRARKGKLEIQPTESEQRNIKKKAKRVKTDILCESLQSNVFDFRNSIKNPGEKMLCIKEYYIDSLNTGNLCVLYLQSDMLQLFSSQFRNVQDIVPNLIEQN